MRFPVTKILLLFLFFFVSCTPASAPPLQPASRYKLYVSADGFYRVTAASLRNAGAALDGIDPATLQLFRGDREIAIRVLGDGSDFAIEFYGEATDSPYSAFNVYWLQWGKQIGKRMREIQTPTPADNPQTSAQRIVSLAPSTLYVAQSGVASPHWFWQSLIAPATTTVTVTLPAALPAQARLHLNLWGNSQDPANPDHHLRVFFNDARVADEVWDGQGAHAMDAPIPATRVRDGNNLIRLVTPGDTPAQVDVILLQSVKLTYTQRLIAQAGALQIAGEAGTYRVEGFAGGSPDLFDITNPDEPARVSNVLFASGAITFRADAPRRWMAIDPQARLTVARVAPMLETTLRARERQADYIVITYPDFVDALQPLVQWREQHGLKVSVVTTNEIYDEFGFGAESPEAIRAFLDWAQHQWAPPSPRFVLLVGKASYDYRDVQKGPNKNLVPTFLLETPNLDQAASDNWFVTGDAATGHPTLAIGRIPARTRDQVTSAVDKTIAYESAPMGDWRRRAIFVADDKDPAFAALSDALAQMARNASAEKIYLAESGGDVTVARAKIISAWNAGAALVTYVGHGSIDTWAAGPLFSAGDDPQLKNGNRLPILFTPTCLDGYFYHPQKDSLSEALLFKRDGGIVAGLVPTGLSSTPEQETLARAFFAELFDNATPTLGEAVMRAKQQIKGDSPETREVIETFTLLGDPALRLDRGN